MSTATASSSFPPSSSPPAYDTSSPPAYTAFPSIIPLGRSIFHELHGTPNARAQPLAQSRQHAAAIREYRASQIPDNWGRRSTHPRLDRRQDTPAEVGGWKSWAIYLLGLMSPDDIMGERGISPVVAGQVTPFMY